MCCGSLSIDHAVDARGHRLTGESEPRLPTSGTLTAKSQVGEALKQAAIGYVRMGMPRRISGRPSRRVVRGFIVLYSIEATFIGAGALGGYLFNTRAPAWTMFLQFVFGIGIAQILLMFLAAFAVGVIYIFGRADGGRIRRLFYRLGPGWSSVRNRVGSDI